MSIAQTPEFISQICAPFVFPSGNNTPIRAPSWRLGAGFQAVKNETNNSLELSIVTEEISSSFTDTLHTLTGSSFITWTDETSKLPYSRKLTAGFGTTINFPISNVVTVGIDQSVIATTGSLDILSSSITERLTTIETLVSEISSSILVISGTIATDINQLNNWETIKIFGDGSDGALIVSSSMTLTRDMYFTDLTVSGTNGHLNTNSYIVYVTGTLDLTNAFAHAIYCSGSNGGDATYGISLGANGAGGTGTNVSGTVGYGAAGADGMIATASTGGDGIYATNFITSANGGNGGRSGNGGNNGSYSGGSGVTGATPVNRRFIHKYVDPITYGNYLINGGAGGSGGASGASGTAYKAGCGGGGGAGGGVLAIYTNKIKVAATTALECISVNGGAGGQGGFSIYSDCASGGGGAGGAGGFIYLCYNSKIGATPGNFLSSVGGVGGNGGDAWDETVLAGYGGQGGYPGMIIVTKLSTPLTTIYSTGTNPVSATTQTGTAGGYVYGEIL